MNTRPATVNRPLTRYVSEILRRDQSRWDRLRDMIRQGRRKPEAAQSSLDALRRQKPLSTWPVRRRLARLRRRQRNAYRREAGHLLGVWRPEFERMLEAARKYRKRMITVLKQERRTARREAGLLPQIISAMSQWRTRIRLL